MSRKMIDYKVEDGKIVSIDGYEVGGGTGGGGNYSVAVQSVKKEIGYKYNINLEWFNDLGLKANTAYNVGDQVEMHVKADFGNKPVDSNQMLVPINSSLSFTDTRIQFGDVIIVLTDTNSSTSTYSETIQNQNYRFVTDAYPVFTVVKAGTTGDNTSLYGKKVSATITYLIYTLGVNKAE